MFGNLSGTLYLFIVKLTDSDYGSTALQIMTCILPTQKQGLYSSVTLEWFRTITLALNTITFQV